MIEQYCNTLNKLNIVIYKKYLDENASNELLKNILMVPMHMKHPLVTKAGQPSKK